MEKQAKSFNKSYSVACPLAQQAQSPEFKPWYHQRKVTLKRRNRANDHMKDVLPH
jgi:hypothetical protein